MPLRVLRLPLALIVLALGCGGEADRNLSAQSTADPARLEKALAQQSAAAEASRKAEAKVLKGAVQPEP